jgi:hypothetical protein
MPKLFSLCPFRLCGSILLAFVFAACTSAPSVPPTLTPPAILPKRLATVYISPTPDDLARQATLAANPPTATMPPATLTPTPTAYIGVFLGEAETLDEGPLLGIQPVEALPTAVVPATAVPSCPAPADVVFGTRWAEDSLLSSTLGCPIEGVSAISGTLQIFERGVMYFRTGGEVWAIGTSARQWWYVPSAPPINPADIPVPEGVLPPASVFGAVWRGIPGVQDALGYARTAEQATPLSTQKFQNGQLLADGISGQVFVLLADGRAFGPY